MTTLYRARPERWPQVSLKSFFVLLTLLCVFLGWLSVQVKWIRDRHEALRTADVVTTEPKPTLSGIPWALRVFREQPIAFIDIKNERKNAAELEAQVRILERLFPEADIGYYSHHNNYRRWPPYRRPPY